MLSLTQQLLDKYDVLTATIWHGLSPLLLVRHAFHVNSITSLTGCAFMQQEGMLEQLAPHLPEEHRTQEGLLAVATSAQVSLVTSSGGWG